MKIIRTASFNKLSKKKEWNPNPWAVCTDSVDKDESPDKYERCVQDVKKKQCIDFEEGLKKALDKKEQETKPVKMPKNNRGQWDADSDFSNRIRDEFSGEADNKKDDALDDKWKQLFDKGRKRQPAFASKKDKKKKEPEMVKPFKR